MKSSIRKLFSISLLWLIFIAPAFAQHQTPNDSGMWLLPQVKGPVYQMLEKKGLKLSVNNFYSTDSTTLNKAIVRVNIGNSGGGTGSFVSPDGLILTNHHIAYDAIASASTTKQNYLKNGFIARNDAEEIPAKGYTLYIPIEQKNVTAELKSMVPDTTTGVNRQRLMSNAEQQIISERKGGNNDLKVEIDNYYGGNVQYMSVYRVIRDVRIVFVPPLSIGKFGGDIDNWRWPRHTGDFSFLRAYVAPDGSGRPYNKDNVPFKPDRYLKISLNGYKTGAFTMIMGFPGFTYRHQSSYAFDYYENHRNPYYIQAFKALVDGLKLAAKEDPEEALKNTSDLEVYMNEYQYYEGVQEGFKKYHVTAKRQAEEAAFSKWVSENPQRDEKYGNVLSQLQRGYKLADQAGDELNSTLFALNYSKLLDAAGLFYGYYHYLQSDTATFSNAERDTVLAERKRLVDNGNIEAKMLTLKEMLKMIATLPANKQIPYVRQTFGALSGKDLDQAIEAYLQKQLQTSVVFNGGVARNFLFMKKSEAKKMNEDDMVELFGSLLKAYYKSRQIYMAHFSITRPAEKLYVEGMLQFHHNPTAYPDANFTLRLSGGRVMGYYPEDGVFYLPETTLDGVIQKDTGEKPFNVPAVLKDWYDAHSTGHGTFTPYNRYLTDKGGMNVDFLTTNDITGGNSGSPVMNAEGQMIGLAFDGNIRGVVGDYYFDPNLNRAINVDIRYVMFITDKIYHVERLIKEMTFVKQQQPAEALGH